MPQEPTHDGPGGQSAAAFTDHLEVEKLLAQIVRAYPGAADEVRAIRERLVGHIKLPGVVGWNAGADRFETVSSDRRPWWNDFHVALGALVGVIVGAGGWFILVNVIRNADVAAIMTVVGWPVFVGILGAIDGRFRFRRR